MPPFNEIAARIPFRTIIHKGQLLTLSVATTTTHWTRPESAVTLVGSCLEDSINDHKPDLPAGTTEVCVRETVHKNKENEPPHLTCVCFKEDGTAETVHMLPKKPDSSSNPPEEAQGEGTKK
ncbi:hypothetical protein GGR55DRAFT_675972 [Xylaria sp. FL0064]|nr:hypothetical protein GGR55DRAFT_675972 [Xylaria sp. FL0064]